METKKVIKMMIIIIMNMTEACYLISIAALALPPSSARTRPLHLCLWWQVFSQLYLYLQWNLYLHNAHVLGCVLAMELALVLKLELVLAVPLV